MCGGVKDEALLCLFIFLNIEMPDNIMMPRPNFCDLLVFVI